MASKKELLKEYIDEKFPRYAEKNSAEFGKLILAIKCIFYHILTENDEGLNTFDECPYTPKREGGRKRRISGRFLAYHFGCIQNTREPLQESITASKSIYWFYHEIHKRTPITIQEPISLDPLLWYLDSEKPETSTYRNGLDEKNPIVEWIFESACNLNARKPVKKIELVKIASKHVKGASKYIEKVKKCRCQEACLDRKSNEFIKIMNFSSNYTNDWIKGLDKYYLSLEPQFDDEIHILLGKLSRNSKLVITGKAGTGKTLYASRLACKLLEQTNKNIMYIGRNCLGNEIFRIRTYRHLAKSYRDTSIFEHHLKLETYGNIFEFVQENIPSNYPKEQATKQINIKFEISKFDFTILDDFNLDFDDILVSAFQKAQGIIYCYDVHQSSKIKGINFLLSNGLIHELMGEDKSFEMEISELLNRIWSDIDDGTDIKSLSDSKIHDNFARAFRNCTVHNLHKQIRKHPSILKLESNTMLNSITYVIKSKLSNLLSALHNALDQYSNSHPTDLWHESNLVVLVDDDIVEELVAGYSSWFDKLGQNESKPESYFYSSSQEQLMTKMFLVNLCLLSGRVNPTVTLKESGERRRLVTTSAFGTFTEFGMLLIKECLANFADIKNMDRFYSVMLTSHSIGLEYNHVIHITRRDSSYVLFNELRSIGLEDPNWKSSQIDAANKFIEQLPSFLVFEKTHPTKYEEVSFLTEQSFHVPHFRQEYTEIASSRAKLSYIAIETVNDVIQHPELLKLSEQMRANKK